MRTAASGEVDGSEHVPPRHEQRAQERVSARERRDDRGVRDAPRSTARPAPRTPGRSRRRTAASTAAGRSGHTRGEREARDRVDRVRETEPPPACDHGQHDHADHECVDEPVATQAPRNARRPRRGSPRPSRLALPVPLCRPRRRGVAVLRAPPSQVEQGRADREQSPRGGATTGVPGVDAAPRLHRRARDQERPTLRVAAATAPASAASPIDRAARTRTRDDDSRNGPSV